MRILYEKAFCFKKYERLNYDDRIDSNTSYNIIPVVRI